MPKQPSVGTLYMRRWRARKGDEYREYMRKWRSEHREHIKASRRQYYLAHKGEEVANTLRWQDKHYDRVLLVVRACNANKRYEGKITGKQIAAIFERDGFTCYWCGRTNLSGRDLTIEHLEPYNKTECLTTACRQCNSKRLHRNGRKKE